MGRTFCLLHGLVMHTDQDFLQVILAEPDDDAPRLMYADWLEERGQTARAEFIRVQCALARLSRSDPQRSALQIRERYLLDEHGHDWLAVLPTWPGVDWNETNTGKPAFQRGFIGSASFDTAQHFVRRAREVFAAAPIVSIFIRRVSPEDIVSLAYCSDAARLSGLSLQHAHPRPEDLQILMRSPFLQELRSLNLGHNPIGGEVLASLAEAPLARRLEYLNLENCRLGDAEAATLATALPSHVQHLVLSYNQLGNAGLTAIARAPGLAALQTLDLAANLIGDGGIYALAWSRSLSGLRTLNLQNNRIGDGGGDHLLGSLWLLALQRLDLRGNRFSPEGRSRLQRRFGHRIVLEMSLS